MITHRTYSKSNNSQYCVCMCIWVEFLFEFIIKYVIAQCREYFTVYMSHNSHITAQMNFDSCLLMFALIISFSLISPLMFITFIVLSFHFNVDQSTSQPTKQIRHISRYSNNLSHLLQRQLRLRKKGLCMVQITNWYHK